MKIVKNIMGYVIPIAIGLALAWLIKTYLFTLVKVDGTSMQPNLQNNERVMMLKQGSVKRFSVVVFNASGLSADAGKDTNYVKRIIGLPGDKIEYTTSGKLLINGKEYSQSFISKQEQTVGSTYSTGSYNLKSVSTTENWKHFKGRTTVPKGYYYVLGDHRSVSNDSRYIGFIAKSRLLGVVKVPFWDSRATIINHYTAN